MNNAKVVHDEYYILDHGNDLCVLTYYRTDVNEKGAALRVSKEVFEYAQHHLPPLRELLNMFKLNNAEPLYTLVKPKEYVKPNDKKDVEKYHGLGYVVTSEPDGYYLNYQLGRHGGGTGRFKIDKTVFNYALKDGVNTADILDKFDLHHLDNEENYHY